MRAAVLRQHGRTDRFKVVLLAPGQDEEMDEHASRPWLYPHLVGQWHLMDFCDVETQEGTPRP